MGVRTCAYEHEGTTPESKTTVMWMSSVLPNSISGASRIGAGSCPKRDRSDYADEVHIL